MKKCGVVIIIFAIIFSLVGCETFAWFEKYKSISDDEVEEKSKEFGLTVINAIANYDEETFNSLFIDEALSSPDFEKGKEYILDIFEGEIISTEYKNTAIGYHIDKYGQSYNPSVNYDIITDKNEYSLYIEYYLRGYSHNGESKPYTNKIIRLRLAIKSELPETGGFNNSGGMGSLEGIYHPDIVAQ